MIELFQINVRLLCQFVVFFIVVLFFRLDSVHSESVKRTPLFQTKFAEDFPTIEQLTFRSVSQGDIQGENLLGQAVVIICFEPGCAGCINKLATLEKIRKTFESDGVTFIALSSSGEGITNIAKQNGYAWVWALNATSLRPKLDAHRAFEIFLFDRTGKIVYRFPAEDRNLMLHLEIGLYQVLAKAVDLSNVPQAFIGSQSCGMCHPNELEQWLSTPHAKSYQTLVASGGADRKECNSCHVTGERGRVKHPWAKTPPELQAMGCEECHGPGGPHRSKPFPEASLYSSKEESCMRCHNPGSAGCSTSWKEPKWNYATALKAITHGSTAPSSVLKAGNILFQANPE